MYHVSVGEGNGHQIVDMGRKASETCFVSHEAMDVDEEQAASPTFF